MKTEELHKIWKQAPPGTEIIKTGTVQEGDFFYIAQLGAWGPVPKIGWGEPVAGSLIARPKTLPFEPEKNGIRTL